MNKQLRTLSIFLAVLIAATTTLISCSNMLVDLKEKPDSTTLTDAESVTADAATLVAASILGTNTALTAVSANLVLPVTGENGTTFTWSSDTPATITSAGAVTRPAAGSGSKTVVLTVTITKGTQSTTKTFTVTVTETTLTDAQAVTADAAAIVDASILGTNTVLTAVTTDLTLLATGANGTTITWSSTTPGTISNAGVVTRPSAGSGDVTVTMTATITKGSETTTKTFTVTVKEAEPVGDYYVSKTGNDANAGTKESPLLTIQAAIGKCDGTTETIIAVAAGTYSQGITSLNVNKSNVRLYGGFNADFSARDNTDRTNATYQTKITSTSTTNLVNCGAQSDITMDGFYLLCSSGTTIINFDGTGSNINLSNNSIIMTGATSVGNTLMGIYFSDTTDDVIVKNNIIDFSAKSYDRDVIGIWLSNTTGEVSANAITLGTQTGISRENRGIVENGTGALNRIILIDNNTLDLGKFTPTGLSMGISVGTMTGAGSNAIITNNSIFATDVVSANTLRAVYINGNAAIIANNTVSFTGTVTDSVIAMGTNGTTTAKFYNNTVYVNIPCSDSPVGIFLNGTDPVAINNIIWLVEDGNMMGIRHFGGATNAQSTFNNIYLSGTGSATDTFVYDASNILGTNPLIDLASDLQFSGSSPATVTAGGTNLYAEGTFMHTDKAGAARPSSGAWAIGAYNP